MTSGKAFRIVLPRPSSLGINRTGAAKEQSQWKAVVAVIVLGGAGFAAYDYRTSPYYGAPVVEDGFVLAYKGEGALRAVMRGIEDERATRRYLSYSARDVKPWYLDTWSECRAATDAEKAEFDGSADLGPGGRLDAVCEIDADGDVFVRGWVASVPDL